MTNVEDKQNFDGVERKQYYTLEELKGKDRFFATSGTTDTDSKTDGSDNKAGYAKNIYSKAGKVHSSGGQKLGTKVKLAKDTRIG